MARRGGIPLCIAGVVFALLVPVHAQYGAPIGRTLKALEAIADDAARALHRGGVRAARREAQELDDQIRALDTHVDKLTKSGKLKEADEARLWRFRLSGMKSQAETIARTPTAQVIENLRIIRGGIPMHPLPDVPPAQREIFRTFDDAFAGRVSKPRIVAAPGRRFGREFIRGAHNAEEHLRATRGLAKMLGDRWLNTPKERRIFLVGSRQDARFIKPVIARLEEQGYSVFYYLNCRRPPQNQLCNSETVGAFYGTSGEVLVSSTAAAAASPYVPIELAAIRSVAAGERVWIMLTPGEISSAGLAMTATIFATPLSPGLTPLSPRL